MDVPAFCVKGKQAFRKELGSLRLLGNAAQLVRKLSEEYSLFHITDLDALKGNRTNFDLYDHFTYFTHVQVEARQDPELLSSLLEMDVRVVIDLPTELDLSRFLEKKNFLLGKVPAGHIAPLPTREILLDGKDDGLARRILSEDKRLFLKKEHYPKGFRRAFGIIFPL